MPIRYLKIALVILILLWALTSLQANVAALDVSYSGVAYVMSMPAFPADAAPPFATHNPTAIWLVVGLIMFGKICSAAFAAYGAFRMWQSVGGDSAAFQRAKQWGIVGGAFTAAWMFLAFITIGNNIFLMFVTDAGAKTGEAAFQVIGSIGMLTLLVAQPD